jgi:ribosomal protein S18 acetylase RimI-like enzyme
MQGRSQILDAMASTLTFAPPSPEDLRAGTLGKQLRAFNYRVVGEYPDIQPVRLDVRDQDSRLVAGIRAYVLLDWMHTDLLWVAQDRRGQGLGSRLLGMAEAQARALGARNAKLETFEWQARAFYIKQGYAEYARIDDYVSDQYLAYLKKPLD